MLEVCRPVFFSSGPPCITHPTTLRHEWGQQGCAVVPVLDLHEGVMRGVKVNFNSLQDLNQDLNHTRWLPRNSLHYDVSIAKSLWRHKGEPIYHLPEKGARLQHRTSWNNLLSLLSSVCIIYISQTAIAFRLVSLNLDCALRIDVYYSWNGEPN